MYTNSENSFNWIETHIVDSPLFRKINALKDKFSFREHLKVIYPDFKYRKISIEQISKIVLDKTLFPFIIKPSIGFLSIGVHIINSSLSFKLSD